MWFKFGLKPNFSPAKIVVFIILFISTVQPQENEIVKLGPIKIPAVLVKGGEFQMGDVFEEGRSEEQPVRKVIVSDFYMSITEVTIGQYKRYCLKTGKPMPDQGPGVTDHHPVAYVTWYEAQEFCNWVGGSLPTEVQWEYAARSGGIKIKYPTGNEITHDDANFKGTGGRDVWKRSAPVGKFPPNPLGIYDLAGNLYEWCFDYYKSNYQYAFEEVDPLGPPSGMFKVVRGGSWEHDKDCLRTTHRYRYLPSSRLSFLGFRVVWDPKKVSPSK